MRPGAVESIPAFMIFHRKRKEKRRKIKGNEDAFIHFPLSSFVFSLPSNELLQHPLSDPGYGARRIQSLRTDIGAVHDGMAAEELVGVIQPVQTLGGRLVTTVLDEAAGLQQRGGAEEAIGVPPVGRTGRGTAGAEDALVQSV